MIKIALLVCSAALAAADADALYGAYGYGTHLSNAGHLSYAGHLGYARHISYAAPVHHAGYGISNIANTVGIHGVAPAAIPAVHGGYAAAGRYVANSAGIVHVAKREAEAEPEADALYGAYGYGGYGLGHRTYSVGLGHGIGHGYSTLGYGHGYGLGHSRFGYGKRSADAEPEADADALYGAYGHGYSLGHHTYSLGYGHGVGHGYSTLGYGHGYGLGHSRFGYGKRSADAEPTADADALYGAYGHGYGLGHHTYSAGYGHGYGIGHGYSTLGHGYGYGRGYGFHG